MYVYIGITVYIKITALLQGKHSGVTRARNVCESNTQGFQIHTQYKNEQTDMTGHNKIQLSNSLCHILLHDAVQQKIK